jgi:hypothetical protein
MLTAQANIINIPIQKGFSPKRWQKIVNAMLEKIPGRPYLHKLRVIHILEADYNLALKEIFGRRLLQNCEKHDKLGDIQDGFRKNRSTIRTLLQNELFCDYNKRLRINNFIGLTDISGCFDRIVTPLISLLNRRNGCPKEAVQMHARTLHGAKYHLKTKQGVSITHYTNSTDTPIHGNGQGAGDSPSQWCQQSAMLFDIYSKQHIGATMINPEGNAMITLPMAAFADDTNLLGNDTLYNKSLDELIKDAQECFTTWNELLYASGHFMELEKCACYLSLWDFQADGYAFTKDPEAIAKSIAVKDIHGCMKTIKLLPATTSQKLLGSMKNPIGNQQDEVQRLLEKSNKMAVLINANAISRSEAKMVYESFYLPAMRYSLSITSINQMDFETIQKNATTAITAALGYNRHMPREVVYGAQKYQGIGLRHLYDIQGSDGIRLLLQELIIQGNSTNSMTRIALETVQVEAGIQNQILLDNRPLPYIEWGWIPSIRDFLLHINAGISNATTPRAIYRQNDGYIMDLPILRTLSRKEQILINRCRLYLQVECVSDITDSTGHNIKKSWIYKNESKNSRSTKIWPKQGDPGDQAWKIWRNFIIKALTDSKLKLHQPLGAWITINKHRQYDAYWDVHQKRLIIQNNGQWMAYKLAKEDRRRCYFDRKTSITLNGIRDLIPMDIIKSTELFYITSRPSTISATSSKTTPSHPKISEDDYFEIMEEEMEIRRLLDNTRLIDSATDGSHDPTTGKMAFGWVIAIGETIVATGKGPAAGHPTQASAFRAEAYGLWSMARYLKSLSDRFQCSISTHKLFIHIDNRALIGRMDRYYEHGISNKSIPFPDSDVTISAFKELKNWQAQLQHVKSHNTSSSTTKSFPESLNEIVDGLARNQLGLMMRPHTEVQSPLCILKINKVYITRDTQKSILEAASKAPIQQYLRDKFEWSSITFDLINWDMQAKILATYDKNDQQRILKFVHEWLPTNHRLKRESQSMTARCPLCYYRVEDNMHLFNCSHPKQIANRLALLQQISQAKIDNHMKPLLTAAIKSAILDPSWQPDNTLVPQDYRRGVEDQNRIGWQQIMRGRFAHSLSRGEKSKEQDLRKVLRLIWDAILSLWTQRNDLVHHNAQETREEKTKRKMEAKIHRCYLMKEKINFQDRARIFAKEEEELLREDPTTIKNWLKIAEKMIRITKREAKASAREKNMMEQYFKWHPPDRTTHHASNSMGSGSTIHVG